MTLVLQDLKQQEYFIVRVQGHVNETNYQLYGKCLDQNK